MARVGSHTICLMVSGDTDLLSIYFVEESYEEHQKEYRQFLAEIGPEAFKRLLLTHRNGITTGWKRVDRVLRDKTKARETILKENPAKNVSLSLHYSFCFKPNEKIARAKGMDASLWTTEGLEAILISSGDKEDLTRSLCRVRLLPVPRGRGHELSGMLRDRFLSLECGK